MLPVLGSEIERIAREQKQICRRLDSLSSSIDHIQAVAWNNEALTRRLASLEDSVTALLEEEGRS